MSEPHWITAVEAVDMARKWLWGRQLEDAERQRREYAEQIARSHGICCLDDLGREVNELEQLRARIRFFAQHIRGYAFFYERGRGRRYIDDVGTAVLSLIDGADLWDDGSSVTREAGGDDE